MQAGRINSRQGTRARGALGLFVAVWLNLALAPCAMAAAAASDHDCPHCPPEQMQGHHDMHAGKHGSAEVQMPCADDLSDCGLDDDFSVDARNGASKLKNAQYELPVAIVTELQSASFASPQRNRPPPWQATAHAGTAPPIHLINCVFLD
ncbi:MAG: hypothetical protein P8X81_03350 [Woeseiaceae bacterium]|jgi:hypothetical protein